MQEIDLGKKEFTPDSPDNPINVGIDNPLEETIPASEVTQPSHKVGDSQSEKYSDREKHLYERVKKLESQLKDKGNQTDNPSKESVTGNPFDLAKSVAALKDFDSKEIDFASKIAKFEGISPEEAINSPEFKTWLKGKRDEDLKANNIPTPNSSSSSYGLPSDEDIGKMSKEEHAKFEKEFLAKQRSKGSGF